MITYQHLDFEPRDDGGMRVYKEGVLDVVIPASVWQYIVMETRIPSSMAACTISASVAGSIGSVLADSQVLDTAQVSND